MTVKGFMKWLSFLHINGVLWNEEQTLTGKPNGMQLHQFEKLLLFKGGKKCSIVSAVSEGFILHLGAFPHWLWFCKHWLRSSWVVQYSLLTSSQVVAFLYINRYRGPFQFQSQREPEAMLIAWVHLTTLVSPRVLFFRQNKKIKLNDREK